MRSIKIITTALRHQHYVLFVRYNTTALQLTMGCTAPRGQHCTGSPTPTLHCVLYPTCYSCVCASSTNNAKSSLHLQHCSTLWVGLHLKEHCGCATTGYIQHCSTLWVALHLEEQQRSIKIICCIVGPSLLCLFCFLLQSEE